MARKVYQFHYDDEYDKDIDELLTGLPRSRKAEVVKNAIRLYLAQGSPVVPVVINTNAIANVRTEIPLEEEPQKSEVKPIKEGKKAMLFDYTSE